jgi:hypothetical protein
LDLEARRKAMREKPVLWLSKHPASPKVVLVPQVARRVELAKGLALEAAFTAAAWVQDEGAVRGGPWCLKRLGAASRAELRAVAKAVRGVRGLREQVAAVRAAAKLCDQRGALQRHLRRECFRCGVSLAVCVCRTLRRQDEGFALPAKRKSGKVLRDSHVGDVQICRTSRSRWVRPPR